MASLKREARLYESAKNCLASAQASLQTLYPQRCVVRCRCRTVLPHGRHHRAPKLSPAAQSSSNRRKIVLVQREVVITAQQRLKNRLRVALNFTHPLVVALAADKSRLMIQLGRLERFPDRRTLRANESGRCESTLFRPAVQVLRDPSRPDMLERQICSIAE